jgi:competence protein ComEC
MIRHAAFSIPLEGWRQNGRWRRFRSRLSGWISRQFRAERDRWVLWTPVGFGAGIGIYFGLPEEPATVMGLAGAGLLFGGFLACRARGGIGLAWLMPLIVVLGFAAAELRTTLIPPHLLAQPMSGLVTGTVMSIEDRPARPRLLLESARIRSAAGETVLERARVSFRSGAAMPDIGQVIEIPAALRPPPPPSAPGAYDFRRAAFFDLVSAVGYATGPYRVISTGEAGSRSWSDRARHWLAGYRLDLSRRIIETLPGPLGALASALLTGERGALPEDVLQAMRDSGLAHLLAISGLHMGLVAGVVFLGLRSLLSLSRRLALRRPIKKWAALGALAFALAYLLLSGASVPTQRAFMMTGLVLIAVLLDREAISMRLVAWAAMLVLVLRPEALLTASFQLSFAAVSALVATYETVATRRRRSAGPMHGWSGRAALYLGALLLTSIVANIATLPFSAYHFNRIATHGLASNMLAVPLTGFWIMPWSVLSLALAPFGLEKLALTPMGWGLDLLIVIAREVSSWPWAVVPLAAWPAICLPMIALAGAWLCLWRGAWRFAGLCGLVATGLVAAASPGPRAWVTADGRLAGYLAEDGRLLLSQPGRDRFAAELWERRAGGAETAAWSESAGAVTCDDLGCTLKIGAEIVAVGGSGRALVDDCRRASIVITTAYAPWCKGPRWVFDGGALARFGGVAIWGDSTGIRAQGMLESSGNRPWSRHF